MENKFKRQMHFSSQSKLIWNETIVTLGLQKKFYYLIALKQIETEIINQKDHNNKINYSTTYTTSIEFLNGTYLGFGQSSSIWSRWSNGNIISSGIKQHQLYLECNFNLVCFQIFLQQTRNFKNLFQVSCCTRTITTARRAAASTRSLTRPEKSRVRTFRIRIRPRRIASGYSQQRRVIGSSWWEYLVGLAWREI